MKREDLVVTIPIPCEVPRARGLWATTFLNAVIQTKVHLNERELIEQEAAELGITKSAFMRWCAVKVAEALQDRRKESEQGKRKPRTRPQLVARTSKSQPRR